MEKPLVSVVIPCYNQGTYLKEAVGSVLSSTYENIEIIIVNDGSTEDIEFLKTFSAPKTKVIHQENQGLSMARNNGIVASKGEYILPLDADDKIHSTYIEKAVNILESDSKIGIVYSEAEFFGEKSGRWKLNKYKFPNILYKNVIFCSALFRKSDWEKVGGYKKEMDFCFEDWEFWISLIENEADVYQIPEILFYYRKSSESMSKKTKKEKSAMFRQIIKLHKKTYNENFCKIVIPVMLEIIKRKLLSLKFFPNLV